jgi:anti-sigma factor (TIGR02949 family)
MECSTARTCISAYLDRALADRQIAALEEHLRSCDRCRMELRMEQHCSAALRRHGTYYRAPPSLAARVGLTLPAPAPAPRHAWHPQAWLPHRRLRRAALAASWLVAVALSAGIAYQVAAPSHHDLVAAEVAADHRRSLLADHLTDIASSDPAAVRRWFDGRFNVPPPVADLSAAGFALAGGRLDLVAGRTVGALVYRHQDKVINLFVWPKAGGERLPLTALSRQGLSILYWAIGNTEYWAVSDDAPDRLRTFQALIERAAGAAARS